MSVQNNEVLKEFGEDSYGTLIFPLRSPNIVYCAGPLFNGAERARMSEIAAVLEAGGFTTFLPQRDGLEFVKLDRVLHQLDLEPFQIQRMLERAVFDLDTYQLNVRCGSQVYNSSGRVPDEGVASEAGQAWILGKPLVNFTDHDARALLTNGARNPLVTGLAQFENVDQLGDLAAALRKKIEVLNLPSDHAVRVQAHVAACLRRGSQLWHEMSLLHRAGVHEVDRNEVLGKLIGEIYGEGHAVGRRHAA